MPTNPRICPSGRKFYPAVLITSSGVDYAQKPSLCRIRDERTRRGTPVSGVIALIDPTMESRGLRQLMATGIAGSTMLRLDRREVVYGCMDRDPGIYLIERGHVKVVAPSRDGKECLLGIYTIGDLVGEICLSEDVRGETVSTLTPAVLRRVSRSRLMAALDNAGLREEFVQYLVRRLVDQ